MTTNDGTSTTGAWREALQLFEGWIALSDDARCEALDRLSPAGRQLTKLGENTYALKTLGHIEGNRWLDGRTGDDTVGLAPVTTGVFTGTRWEIVEVDRGVFTLRTLGTIDGPRWLDGRTHNGTVGLTRNIGGVFTGARWRIHRYLPSDVPTQHNDNGRSGASLAETVLEPSLLRVGRFGKLFARDIDGAVFGQPLYADGLVITGKGIHNVVLVGTTLNYVYAFDADDPAQAAPLWRSPQLGTPVHRANLTPFTLIDPAIGITSTPVIDRTTGTMYVVAKSKTMAPIASLQDLHSDDRILLECLGTIPGPRWLDGRTADASVGLAGGTTFPFTGTVWEVNRAGNDRITLRKLGHLVTFTMRAAERSICVTSARFKPNSAGSMVAPATAPSALRR